MLLNNTLYALSILFLSAKRIINNSSTLTRLKVFDDTWTMTLFLPRSSLFSKPQGFYWIGGCRRGFASNRVFLFIFGTLVFLRPLSTFLEDLQIGVHLFSLNLWNISVFRPFFSNVSDISWMCPNLKINFIISDILTTRWSYFDALFPTIGLISLNKPTRRERLGLLHTLSLGMPPLHSITASTCISSHV